MAHPSGAGRQCQGWGHRPPEAPTCLHLKECSREPQSQTTLIGRRGTPLPAQAPLLPIGGKDG